MCLFVHRIGKHVINTLGLRSLPQIFYVYFAVNKLININLIFYVYFAVISSSAEDAKYQCYTLCDINKLLDKEYLVFIVSIFGKNIFYALSSYKMQDKALLQSRACPIVPEMPNTWLGHSE